MLDGMHRIVWILEGLPIQNILFIVSMILLFVHLACSVFSVVYASSGYLLLARTTTMSFRGPEGTVETTCQPFAAY